MDNEDGSALNELERQVRDALKAKLGALATITKLKQNGEVVDVHIVSPADFNRAAGILEASAGQIAANAKCELRVTLSTSWRPS